MKIYQFRIVLGICLSARGKWVLLAGACRFLAEIRSGGGNPSEPGSQIDSRMEGDGMLLMMGSGVERAPPVSIVY